VFKNTARFPQNAGIGKGNLKEGYLGAKRNSGHGGACKPNNTRLARPRLSLDFTFGFVISVLSCRELCPENAPNAAKVNGTA
jgi:hypothetical protein